MVKTLPRRRCRQTDGGFSPAGPGVEAALKTALRPQFHGDGGLDKRQPCPNYKIIIIIKNYKQSVLHTINDGYSLQGKKSHTRRSVIRTLVANVTTLWIRTPGWSRLAVPDLINEPQCERMDCDLNKTTPLKTYKIKLLIYKIKIFCTSYISVYVNCSYWKGLPHSTSRYNLGSTRRDLTNLTSIDTNSGFSLTTNSLTDETNAAWRSCQVRKRLTCKPDRRNFFSFLESRFTLNYNSGKTLQ